MFSRPIVEGRAVEFLFNDVNKKGILHGWFMTEDPFDGKLRPNALIEMENGHMAFVPFTRVKCLTDTFILTTENTEDDTLHDES